MSEKEKKRIEEGEDFLHWCRHLHIDKVKQYLDEGKDINYFDEKKRNGPWMAFTYNSERDRSKLAIELVNLLISSGKYELNMKGKYGRTILHLLFDRVFHSYTFKLFEKIIHTNDIDLNIQDEDGRSALITLCLFNMNVYEKEVLQILINDKRCDLNLKDNTGKTALMYLSILFNNGDYVDIEVFDLFIKNERCDLNLKDNEGKDILWYVCKNTNAELMKKFLLDCGNRLIIDQSIKYPMYQDLIEDYLVKQRNKIGTLLISIKKESKINTQEKRKLNEMEENPLKILPNELIHLILSYSHPLAPQTKYCLN